VTVSVLAALTVALALDSGVLDKIARGSQPEREEALSALVAAGDAGAARILRALLEGRLHTAPEGPVLIEQDGAFSDALTGASVAPADDLEKVTINNRFRRSLQRALLAFGQLRLIALGAVGGAAVAGRRPGHLAQLYGTFDIVVGQHLPAGRRPLDVEVVVVGAVQGQLGDGHPVAAGRFCS